MSLIEVKNLEKIYVDGDVKTPALNGVDLTINEGEFVAIIGASGSGKSTLLQILGGLDRSSGGAYIFNGHNINDYSDEELAHIRNKEMGFVFQAFNLLPKLTVLENVKLPLVYAELSEVERDKKARAMVDLVALSDRIDFKTTKLSGGQKQRVAIARALVNNPKVIFADEPTGSLDSKSGETIMAFLQKLHEKGHTIILVTHESYVAESSERILHIKDGLIDKDEKVLNRRLISEVGFRK
ncbi:MAG: ABC transporter related protein [Candidatus Yanofskybacteria bacterium GW2011_GWD2_39_48]|uniref:ABC transporter related protein n=1 Tax=Candidatus Yanofskybacteria bacterium GW2011_GWD2_39_48 TaxID=1619031 RepID=A0A0G0PBA6_9BACT|nr:MAG: ABC transporter related protein [Candidatus Yanofskybacteria bacterium GW2011_GWD2_39_48]